MSNIEEIHYPNPTCPSCDSKRALAFHSGKIECTDCSVVVWENKEKK